MKNKYKILGDIAIVYCYCRGSYIEVTLDLNCLPIVNSIEGTWGIDRDVNGKMYCKYELNPGRIYMHRLVSNCPIGLVPDHIDGNSINNCLSNLNITTQSLNTKDKKLYSTNKSGIQGVSYKTANSKWVAKVAKKEIGLFNDKYDAGRAVTKERLHVGLRVIRKPICLSNL